MNNRMKFNLFEEGGLKRTRIVNAEKEKKVSMLRGMEKLMPLGGFIRDVIIEELEELFPYKVLDVVYKYADTEKGFWDVLGATQRAFYNMKDYEFGEDGEPIGLWEDDFSEWYIEQTGRVSAERVKKENPCFWSDWELSAEARSTLKAIPLFDEYILFLRNGLDGSGERNAKEIAALPEFEGNEAFIEKMFKRLERYLQHSEQVKEEFGQACELHRTINENE